MDVIGMTFGIVGLVFGLLAYYRIDNLENKLKQFDVIPSDFDSSIEPKEDAE